MLIYDENAVATYELNKKDLTSVGLSIYIYNIDIDNIKKL